MTRTLIEKLEAADGPSRELDAEIHDALHSSHMAFNSGNQGWKVLAGDPRSPTREYFELPAYTSSLDAAVALVERVLPEVEFDINGYRKFYSAVVYTGGGPQNEVGAQGKHPALALCIALLKALEAREESE